MVRGTIGTFGCTHSTVVLADLASCAHSARFHDGIVLAHLARYATCIAHIEARAAFVLEHESALSSTGSNHDIVVGKCSTETESSIQ